MNFTFSFLLVSWPTVLADDIYLHTPYIPALPPPGLCKKLFIPNVAHSLPRFSFFVSIWNSSS